MSKEEIKLNAIELPLITEDELRIINNNFESIIKQFTETLVKDKELAIAQYIIKEQQEELNKYCCKRNDCGSRLKENNKPTDSEVLTEFEKWLEEDLKNEIEHPTPQMYCNCYSCKIKNLDKLQELKGDNK